MFRAYYGNYSVTNNDTGQRITAGGKPFIHEFLDLTECFGAAPRSVTLSFESGPAALMELKAYTAGTVPDSVQKWELPAVMMTSCISQDSCPIMPLNGDTGFRLFT